MATLEERPVTTADRAPSRRGEPAVPSALWAQPSQAGPAPSPTGLSATLVLADFMAVAVALPALQRATGASFPELEWVLAAFPLAMAVAIVTSGHLCERLGPRLLWLAGLTVLGAGSLLAGATHLAPVLIVARAVQGLGAGLVPAGPGVGGRRPGVGSRSAALGGRSAAVGGGLVLAASPLAGGLLTTYLGWPSVFLVEAAAAVTALALTAVASGRGRRGYRPPRIPEGPAAPTGRADWGGLGLMASAFAVLVAGLVRTTANLDGWLSSGILACFACAGLLLMAFVAVESVSPGPLLPPSLWRRRSFVTATTAAFGASMALSGTIMLIVLYLSFDLGIAASGAGARLLALTGASVVLLGPATLGARLVPAKALLVGGLVLGTAGLYAMSRISATSGWLALLPGLLLAGAGLGLTSPRLTLAVAQTDGARRTPAASRSGWLARPGGNYQPSTPAAERAGSWARQLGVATGVAVSGSVFATQLTTALGRQFPVGSARAGQGPMVAALVLQGKMRQATRSVGREALRASFASAMHDVVLVAAGAGGACAVLALATVVAVRRRAARGPERSEPRLPGERPQAGAVLWVPPRAPVPDSALSAGPPPAPSHPATALAAGPSPAGPSPAGPSPAGPSPAGLSPAGLSTPPLPHRSSEAGPPGAHGGGVPGQPPTEHHALEGVVTDRDGRPIAGARLTLMGWHGERAGEGVSDVSGRFSIEAGSAGSYTLVATAPTYRAATRVVQVGAGPGRTELKLFGVGSLAGKVTNSKDGSPLEAELWLRTREGALAMRCRASADGTFAFSDVLEGGYELVASAHGHGTERLPVDINKGSSTVATVSLTGLGHIYGAVSSGEGAWVPDVSVTLSLPSGQPVATTRTDDAGSYRFGDVSEGSYLLRAGNGEGLPVEVAAGQAVAADVRLTGL